MAEPQSAALGAERWDAVVVGAGHNGLVAATYLARAGMRVAVCERRSLVGGACTTEEFAPGFLASPGAYVLSLLRPAIWEDFALRRRGLEVLETAPTLNVFRDGAHLTLDEDPATTAAALARFDRRDGAAFADFQEEMLAVGELLGPWFDHAPPGAPGAITRRSLPTLARTARGGRKRALEAARLFTSSASEFLGERFRSEHVQAALGWDAISNTLAGPSTPGTAYCLLHEHAASALGGSSWGFVRGGMGQVTQLLADAARESGVVIALDAPVAQILVEDGSAAGVRLEDGSEIRGTRVLSNADPKRTFLGLVEADSLEPKLLAQIRNYRSDGASMKINLAVGELPQLGDDVDLRGLIQLTMPLAQMDIDQEAARRGIPSLAPHVELCVPSVLDPTLAPAGKHVITLGLRSQPYRLAEAGWDARADEVADAVIAELGAMIPNLPGSIIAREVLSPLALERTLALTGGHHLHGDMSPDQLGPLRPVLGLGGYRTPIGGLYLCGAGTHPGGGVTGANGRNCAIRVIADRRGRRRARSN